MLLFVLDCSTTLLLQQLKINWQEFYFNKQTLINKRFAVKSLYIKYGWFKAI